MAGTRPSKWTVVFWLSGLAVLAVVMSWGWLRAWWVYPDLSEQQRVESFNEALVARRGVAARLDRGGMAVLARSDVAQVGPSQCARESECSESLYGGRRNSVGCFYVSVDFHCTYAVTTTDGSAATGFLKVRSNRNFSIGVTPPGVPKPLEVEGPQFRDEYQKLAAGAQPAAQTPAPKAAPPPPPPSEAADCKGLRIESAGASEICLDPGDPARRNFRDCNDDFCGPAMVALPKGRGVRGSSAADIARLRQDDPRSDAGTYRSETPQREVTIGYQVAVGKFEVTFDEWDACVADGGCKYRPTDPSHPSRGVRPVAHVSWIDVSDEFLPWLNRKLGLSGAGAYRLLSEAEWEYAARAGTSTKYAFGDLISTAQAKFFGGPSVDVGSFPPNAFGLHDMHGNVAEWVQDCRESDYTNAPVDGSAYDPGNCSSRIYRGGGWHDAPTAIRSADRSSGDPKDRSGKGFRVARTLAVR